MWTGENVSNKLRVDACYFYYYYYFLREKKAPFSKNIQILVDRAQQLYVHHPFLHIS